MKGKRLKRLRLSKETLIKVSAGYTPQESRDYVCPDNPFNTDQPACSWGC